MGMKIMIEICFFSLKKDSRSRGHEVKLIKDQCRLDIRKYSFSLTEVNEWNKLSTDCVTNLVEPYTLTLIQLYLINKHSQIVVDDGIGIYIQEHIIASDDKNTTYNDKQEL